MSIYSSFIEFWQAHVQEWLWHASAGGDGWYEQGGGGQHDQGHNQQCQLDWTRSLRYVVSWFVLLVLVRNILIPFLWKLI